jgi:ubiquinone/menaquinone biosynthesis C-methylase UbiE
MQEHRAGKADYWGRFSGSYDEKVERLVGKELRPAIARLLEREPDPGNVLEIGCGTGYFTRAIARKAGHVTATDVSQDMLVAAKRNLSGSGNISFKVENAEALSFPPETFDTVLAANMLHMLDHPLNALKECHRVLKKGGTLLIINYTDEGMTQAGRIWMLFRFAIMFGIPPKKSWPVTRENLRQQLMLADFTIEHMSLLYDRINAIYLRAKKA